MDKKIFQVTLLCYSVCGNVFAKCKVKAFRMLIIKSILRFCPRGYDRFITPL